MNTLRESLPYPREELIEHYERMLLIRGFETRLSELFAEGKIAGTAHFCIGQEACAVGAVAALRADDLVTSNHRGHGHLLAKGADPGRLMAELFGKSTGYCGGRSGSQHLCALNIGFLGSNGITGGMTAVATGAALSQAVLKTGRVVLCFLGDGATGQGVFWEAVNMAIVWRLPIVYLCENNQYAMSLHISRAFGEPSVAKRLSGYGLPTRTVDGMDYLAVRAATEAAVKHARGGEGPVLIEAMTYRFCGHSKSDECAYRNREEEEEWRRRDPLLIMRDWLCGRGVIDGAADEKLRQKVVEEIDKAVEYARSSPDPDPATVRCHLFGGCYSAGET